MTFGGTKIAAVLLAVVWVMVFAGAAGAQGTGERTERENPQAALKTQVREHDVRLDKKIEDLAAIGTDLEDAQARMESVQARARELRFQTRQMNQDLKIQRKTFEASKARYEEQARAAYKGNELEGLAILLRSLLGGGPAGSTSDIRVAGILLDGQENLQTYGDDRQTLSNTIRQLAQKKQAYNEMLEQEQVQAENLRRQEKKLDAAIARIRSHRSQAEARLQELKARERERILKARAATGGNEPQRSNEEPRSSEETRGGEKHRIGNVSRGGGRPEPERTSAAMGEVERPQETTSPTEQEDTSEEAERRIAQEDIYVQPVENPSEASYWQLYQKAARDYGFARDWYILAAVGKIESNHGESVGTSSSGAMGPMQFMPSTWEVSGVDGNGDGKAIIMDPEDAIPAAAGYLRDGGAPGDWYAALYSYNHADWYVKEVLAVAEGYRKMANDDSVGPYI